MALEKEVFTYTHHFTGVGSWTATTTPATIRGWSFTQGNVSSNTDILCGGSQVYRNFAVSIPFTETVYYCPSGISVSKSGNDEAYVMLNISGGDFHYTNMATTTAQSATTTARITDGDFFISFWIFLLLVATLTGKVYNAVMNNIPRKYHDA